MLEKSFEKHNPNPVKPVLWRRKNLLSVDKNGRQFDQKYDLFFAVSSILWYIAYIDWSNASSDFTYSFKTKVTQRANIKQNCVNVFLTSANLHWASRTVYSQTTFCPNKARLDEKFVNTYIDFKRRTIAYLILEETRTDPLNKHILKSYKTGDSF